MALNIFPRRREPVVAEAAPEPEQQLPEPSAEALEDAKKRTRRGSRGGRGRSRAGQAPTEDGLEQPSAEAPEAPEQAPPPARTRARPAALAAAEKPPAEPARPRGRKAETAEELEEKPAPRARGGRGRPAQPAEPVSLDGNLQALARAIEHQTRQIDHLVRTQEELLRKGGTAVARPARVGVFVDVANVELAADRLRARFDWGKILALLTRDRELVRAVAYSPVHEDMSVSIETQRFVEPFLDKGYKIVTKPVKRFSDGTIKGNVDIELALDVMTMLDRLDVVCLVSGDGDFQRLIEVVQARGVRVEVVAVGGSVATNLRNAADHYIDLQARLREVRA
jgi:uncharacterized LabA/DUF88 family protein